MNYIMEVGIGENAIGRKPSLLAFNAERGYIIGVDMGRFRIRMMLADLLGNEIARTEIMNSANFEGDGKQSIQLVRDQVTHILKKSGKTKDDILCIVIGIPGVMKDGVSYIAPFSEQYLERDMVETLQDAFEVDVLLENCVNLGALGEQWKGAGIDYNNITYIAYGVGLGAAHIFDGKLFTGANGAAGEIGFMITDPINIDNVYRDVGSLEETLSRSKIKKYLNAGNFDEEIKKLIQRYKDDGDMYAKLIIDEVVLNFGMALINMSAILNPEVIIIAGGLGTNLGRLFIDRWKEMLSSHVPFVPEVLLSELNHTETMLGAVMTGIIHVHAYEI
ncbi:MAG: ROK family protein [Oscillospiraceae bacterium]|nr:ROK family protein [Oscillospiraceae bacterium]